MIKAVVFDLDGTLLDSIPDIASALNHALAARGFPTHTDRAVEGFVGGGIRAAVRNALPRDASPEDEDRVLALYRPYYKDHCTERTLPYPGIGQMLSALAEEDIPLFVLSNKSEDTARVIISHFFPQIPFRGVFGRVNDRPLKPAPGAAAPIFDILDLPPEEIAYVGDSGTDVTFARAAGMLPVATPWGYRSREELAAAGAAYIPNDTAELLTLLKNLT